MITAAQLRAARAALRWSAETLARSAGVGVQTVKRIDLQEGVPGSRAATLLQLQRTLEAAGIEFIGTPDDGPGIRYRPPKA